jgi:hypothetical protein
MSIKLRRDLRSFLGIITLNFLIEAFETVKSEFAAMLCPFCGPDLPAGLFASGNFLQQFTGHCCDRPFLSR